MTSKFLTLLRITEFIWLISFALTSWYGELQAMAAFGFILLYTRQMIIGEMVDDK